MQKIAFIGLGHMGAPMAANLVRAGFHVTGYDLVPELCDAARDLGVAISADAVEAVTDAEVVITMLPAGKHVLALYDEVLAHTPEGALFVDCSTISVEESRQAAAAVAAAGHRALDAPVSGGVIGAQNASLAFMVGGESLDFDAANPFLKRWESASFTADPRDSGRLPRSATT